MCAGFGMVCTFVTYIWTLLSQKLGLFWPLFSDAAFLALAYPLFILVACDAKPEKAFVEDLDSTGNL